MTLKVVEGGAQEGSKGPRLPIVAIDGPAGAGKSTAARLLAYRLGLTLIDTGALYRALAHKALQEDVGLDKGCALAELASKIHIQFGKLECCAGQSIPVLPVFCDEVDVSRAIRTPELGMAASNISKLPEVREALLQMQRDFGEQGGIVMEGRDIGTVIFPNANLKFFLTASVESRAKRRWSELNEAGSEISLERVVDETRARDEQDMNREVAPLKQAEDAILIDSSESSLEDVVREMVQYVRDYQAYSGKTL